MTSRTRFQAPDFWRAIVLYGLNNATYKIALGKCLLNFAEQGLTHVSWEELSRQYFDEYVKRLTINPSPQQINPSRLTVMERIVHLFQSGSTTYDQAIENVGREAFGDVIPRFQTIGTNKELAACLFYDYTPGRALTIHDSIFQAFEGNQQTLFAELDARWSLLEGAFTIRKQAVIENIQLANGIRQVYLQSGHGRKELTSNVPFLRGYQGGVCFYCGESLEANNCHVDHVLPRQVLQNDEIWNLVLSHKECNLSKSDRLVGPHFIEKLIARNENIMGSNHPWKQRIEQMLGNNPLKRRQQLGYLYDNVKKVIGSDYWGGNVNYHPEQDPFYRQLVTLLNNG